MVYSQRYNLLNLVVRWNGVKAISREMLYVGAASNIYLLYYWEI